jgi:hypothetical protein
MNQFGHLLGIGERLAVIRKWERNEATTADPTTNAAKDDAVRELVRRRRSGVNHRFIAVRAAQSVKPWSTMKHRTMRMTVDKILPTWILQRIEFVNAHKGSIFKLRCQRRK